jgi:hypothetical protein
MKFIPVDQNTATQFEEKMGKNLLYRSTDNFVAIYNNNLINKNNPEIDKVARAIVEVYKNISLINKQFIIKSEEEVVSDQFQFLFPYVSFIATLKRIGENVLSENYPEDTKFVFTESDKNLVQLFDPSTGEVVAYQGAERLKNANEMLAKNPFLEYNVTFEDHGEDGIAFKVMDVMKIDTSFITKIGELLEDYLK